MQRSPQPSIECSSPERGPDATSPGSRLASPASFEGIRHDAYDVGSQGRQIPGRGRLDRWILEWGGCVGPGVGGGFGEKIRTRGGPLGPQQGEFDSRRGQNWEGLFGVL